MRISNIILIALLSIILLFGCKSIDLPSAQESQRKIDFHKKALEITESKLSKLDKRQKPSHDISLSFNKSTLNEIFTKLAKHKKNDLVIKFKKSNRIIEDKVSILGIKDSNYLSIKKGHAVLDLSQFKINKISSNKLFGKIQISGKGNIAVTGKYTGISADASPSIKASLIEDISFDLRTTDSGYVVLKPQAKTLKMKTTFTVKILGWDIPWNSDIDLDLHKILKPIAIPIALKSEVSFPLPGKENEKANKDRIFTLKMENAELKAHNDQIRFNADINFRKK